MARSLAAFLDRKKCVHALREEALNEQEAIELDLTLKGERRKKAEKRVRKNVERC